MPNRKCTLLVAAALVATLAACSGGNDSATRTQTPPPDSSGLSIADPTGSRVPVKRSVAGFSTLVVSKVSATGVDFGGSTANASVSAGDQGPGNRFQLNNLVVTTVAIQGSTAILRLRPA
ncbi:MAG TPA: hypothetical protein VGD15_05935 [Kribbella sp.]|jgi:hypothetical protein